MFLGSRVVNWTYENFPYARRMLHSFSPVAHFLDNDLETIVKKGKIDWFNAIELEVNRHCNRSCWYCPNVNFKREEAYMDFDLYAKIIDELAAADFRGRLSPHFFGEPLLHPRLGEYVAYARQKLPWKRFGARIVLFTNGDFLNTEKYDQLREAGVDMTIVTKHGKSIPPGLQALLEREQGNRNLTIRSSDDFMLYNRGGLVYIPDGRRAIPDPCFFATKILTVRHDGDVILCCNDYHGKTVFGNAGDTSIIDIWNSESYRRQRTELRQRRYNLPVCRACVGPSACPSAAQSHYAAK